MQPEWFLQGDGSWLVGPGQPLPMPSFALDGGEEPELAGLYLIDDKGRPVRLGFALGTSIPTTSPSGRTISTSPTRSFGIPPLAPRW